MPAQPLTNRALQTIKGVSFVLIIVSIVMLLRALPLGDGVAALKSWVESLGIWGPVAFGVIYVLAVVAMLPASLLTLVAGATFGLLMGTITVSLASNIGAACAFLIARYLARSRVEQFVRERPKFAAIDQAIDEGGWKIVALLRLSPAVPFNVQNYFYGLTSIRFWTCVLTSWVAMLPGTFLYVYLGHAAGSVTGGTRSRTAGEWALLGIGLLATIAVTVYVTRLAQRKLREQSAIDGPIPSGDQVSEQAENASTQVAEPRGGLSPMSVLLPACVAILLMGLAGVTHFKPDLVKSTLTGWLAFGPPAVEMTEQYDRQTEGPVFDHAIWNDLLKRHVDADGWVDYPGFQQDASQLDNYLESIAAAPFDDLGRDEKLALLINAYNAFTVRLILDHWPLQSIKDIPDAQRWSAVRWNVGGNLWSLEQIEHQQIRPNFKEPRIHFALVCAAIGCPPLRDEAYTGEQLESQLQQQTEYVHAHQTWLHYDPEQSLLKHTALYDWYAGDFKQSAGSVPDFIARYSTAQREQMADGSPPRTTTLPYDWSLNDVSNRRPR